MAFFKKYWLIIWWLLLVIAGLFTQWTTLRLTDSTIYDTKNNLTQHGYANFWSNGQETYRYALDLQLQWSTTRVFQLYPNDCIVSLSINNIPYKFPSSANLCDTWFGVTVYGANYLQKGYNNITVEIKQQWKGNSFVLKLFLQDYFRQLSIVLLLIGCALILLHFYLQLLKTVPKIHKLTILFAVLLTYVLGSWYIYGIDYFQRTHDLIGHLDHMRVVMRGDWLPRANLCWECYHPPLFYWITTLSHQLAGLFARLDPMEFVRIVTYSLFHVGIFFGVAFFLRVFYTSDKPLFRFSLFLFLLRPTNFIYGGRIMNDVWFYAFSFATIYYSYCLFQDPTNRKYLRSVLISFGLGLLTKSNSIIWLPLVLSPFIVHYISSTSLRHHRQDLKKQYMLLLPWILIIVLIVGSINLLKDNSGVVGNADRLTNELSVKHITRDRTFFHFDYTKFIHNTSTYTFNDSGERGLFRNFLAKTMITWEMDVTQLKNVTVFPYLHFVFIILSLYATYYVLTSKKDQLFFVAGFAFPLIAMIIFRIKYPFGSSMHYRYIFPHLLFFIYFTVLGLRSISTKNINLLNVFYILCIVAFLILSLVFSIPPYF